MRPIGTCVWSTRANPFCLRRTWLTFSGLWVSSTVPVARITSGKCGAPCGKFAICLSQTKAVRYPCAALFAWLPSADDATKVWAASSSPSWDLGVGSVWRVIFAAELNSFYDRAGARIHEVLAACRCWQQGEPLKLWKDPHVDVPEAEAVFLAAWVLHVAASPPEVPMPHACVFCGTLMGVGDPAGACRNCRLRSARIERLVSESSSDS